MRQNSKQIVGNRILNCLRKYYIFRFSSSIPFSWWFNILSQFILLMGFNRNQYFLYSPLATNEGFCMLMFLHFHKSLSVTAKFLIVIHSDLHIQRNISAELFSDIRMKISDLPRENTVSHKKLCLVKLLTDPQTTCQS